MFENLRGKKLLILSGVAMNAQTVKLAQEMGIYTIVTDYYTDYTKSPAKLVADEIWDISWNDIDTLEKKCREEKVDGVITGYSESYVLAAIKLCKRMNWSFYADETQIDITRNKALFKPLCKENGMPVVEIFEVSAIPTQEELNNIKYPVVVKPSDSAGSRGISVCKNEDELIKAIAYALEFSESNRFIVETFMSGTEVCVYYTIQDGEATLSSSLDAVHGYQKEGTIQLTEGWLTPSKYLKEFVEKADENCKKVLKALNAKNGTFEFSMFYDGNEFRVFECGYRLGGATNFNFSAANNEINYLKMMIAHSLTGKMSGWNAKECENPFYSFYGCDFTPTARPGVIGYAGDFNKVRKSEGVISADEFYFVGSEVPDSGAMNQNYARINVIADSPEELAERIEQLYAILDVRDIEQKNMFCSRLNREMIVDHWK